MNLNAQQIDGACRAGLRMLAADTPVPASQMDSLIVLRTLLSGVVGGQLAFAAPENEKKAEPPRRPRTKSGSD